MDYRDNRQRWAESHQVVHFYAGQWCTFTPALTEEQIDQLKQDVLTAQEQTDRLDRKNKELIESAEWRWYMAGAGTLAAGLIIGFAIPRRRRRSTWDSP